MDPDGDVGRFHGSALLSMAPLESKGEARGDHPKKGWDLKGKCLLRDDLTAFAQVELVHTGGEQELHPSSRIGL
jgi:hypothetical protein